MIKIPLLLNKLLDKAKSLVMEELNPEMTGDQNVPESPAPEPLDVSPSVPVTTPQPVKKITWQNGITAIFNGIGIGMLLGILVGLSVSPVVSGVIATITGLLAVLLGLDEKYLDPLKSIRIGAFGLAAVAGVVTGLYIRAFDPLSPSLRDKMDQYIEMGYSDAEARAFITKTIQADTVKDPGDDNVLYNSTIDVADCENLAEIKADWTVEEMAVLFNYLGGTWGEFAQVFQADLPDEIAGKALLTMRDCFCTSNASGEIKMTNLEEIRKLENEGSVEQIEEVLSSPASGENWQKIVVKVRENIPQSNRQEVYVSIIKVLGYEE